MHLYIKHGRLVAPSQSLTLDLKPIPKQVLKQTAEKRQVDPGCCSHCSQAQAFFDHQPQQWSRAPPRSSEASCLAASTHRSSQRQPPKKGRTWQLGAKVMPNRWIADNLLQVNHSRTCTHQHRRPNHSMKPVDILGMERVGAENRQAWLDFSDGESAQHIRFYQVPWKGKVLTIQAIFNRIIYGSNPQSQVERFNMILADPTLPTCKTHHFVVLAHNVHAGWPESAERLWSI